MLLRKPIAPDEVNFKTHVPTRGTGKSFTGFKNTSIKLLIITPKNHNSSLGPSSYNEGSFLGLA